MLELPIRFQNGYVSAAQQRQVMENLANTSHSQSMVEVEVGTPAVSHSLLFDTGSATSWMFSADCDGTTSCPNNSGYNRTAYDEDASSTAELLDTTASISYLGGSTSGLGVEDVFSVPSAANTSWRQTFLAATRSTWFNIPADGFLGMAFNTIASANTSTMVETLIQESFLDEPRFGLYYGTEVEDTGGSPGSGTLTLGGSHEDVYVNGSMVWAPLSAPANPQLWRVNMQYMTGTRPINGAATSTTAAVATTTTRSTIPLSGAWGVFDTGAGRIYVPDPYVEAIYASIGMNYSAILNGDHIPLCTEFTNAWSVSFHFGSAMSPTRVTITGDMMRKPGFATGEDKYCWPPFETSDSNGLFLFGGEFLQQLYTVFDFGGTEAGRYNARIGFGALKDEYKVVVL